MSWTKDERSAFSLLLLAMGEVFNESISPERIELCCLALDDLPFANVREAAARHMRTGKFFPRPAELRELIAGNPEDGAEIAWIYMLREVKRVGWTGKPSWPDDVTARTALGLFGSWRSLCENLPAGGPELVGYRKQFVALYGATARQAQLGELGPSREDAKTLLADMTKAVNAQPLPDPSGSPRPASDRDARLRLVAKQIVESVQRCEEAEAAARTVTEATARPADARKASEG